MPQVKGKVVGVKVTKTGVKIPGRPQSYDRLSVQIEDSEGKKVSVQKLAKAGNDGSELLNKNVDVTYTEKEVVHPETGESFMSRSTDSKGFIILNEDGTPMFTPGAPGRRSNPASTSNHSAAKSSGYNADGARNGMIVGKAVELAIARKETSLEGLRNAARDVIQLTSEVEANNLGSSVTSQPQASAASTVSSDEEEDPFAL